MTLLFVVPPDLGSSEDASVRGCFAIWFALIGRAGVATHVVGAADETFGSAPHGVGAPDAIVSTDIASLEGMRGAGSAGRPVIYIPSEPPSKGLAARIAAAGVSELWVDDPAAWRDVAASGLVVRLLPVEPGDPTPYGDLVADGLGLDLRTQSDAPETMVRNLKLRTELRPATFNPATRLYDAIVAVHGGRLLGGELDVDLRVTDATTREDAGSLDAAGTLDNAWTVEIGAIDSEPRLFRASAILPARHRPEDLRIEVLIGGRRALDVDPVEGLREELAGLISVEVHGQMAEIDYWATDTSCRLQFGRKDATPIVLRRPGDDGPGLFRAEAPWPADRNTITALPPEGVGQRFSLFESIDPRAHPSSARLLAMRNAYAGRAGWLIGNGPSVRTSDLDILRDEVTFCFNRFHLAYGDTTLRPTFTVSGDKQMIEDFGEEIVAEAGGSVFLSHFDPPEQTGDYIWLRQVRGFPSLFSKNAAERVAPGGASAYVAMQIGYFLGIRKFYLYGADFKFVFARDRFQKDAFRNASGEGNHFIKNYRSGRPWCPPSIQNIIPSYYAARHLMESEGGFVKNATRGGVLEVFDRIDFDDAVAESRGEVRAEAFERETVARGV